MKEQIFNDQELTDFGAYLLSDERKKLIKTHPNIKSMQPLGGSLKTVYHADFENWKLNKQIIKSK